MSETESLALAHAAMPVRSNGLAHVNLVASRTRPFPSPSITGMALRREGWRP